MASGQEFARFLRRYGTTASARRVTLVGARCVFKNAFDKANNEPVTGRKFSTKPLAIDLPHNAILYSIGLELPTKIAARGMDSHRSSASEGRMLDAVGAR